MSVAKTVAIKGKNILDAPNISVSLWRRESKEGYKLWSLLQIMQEVKVSALAEAIEYLEYYRTSYEGGYNERQKISEHLNVLIDQCKLLRLKNAVSTIETALRWFSDSEALFSAESKNIVELRKGTAAVHIEHAKNAVVEQLDEIRFFALAPDRVQYYSNPATFGAQVVQAFPSAERDILDGLNCLALEMNTASVFHFMRIAEIGLRALAHDRQVQIPKGKPFELATWEDLIRQLEASEEQIHMYPATLAREQQYEFYHGALMEVRRFKNVFRNRVTHTREDYDRDQALSVFTHVRQFMAILSTKISETSPPLPQIW